MAGAHTDFILSTNHTQAFHATQFAALNREAFAIRAIQFCAQRSHHHLLSGSHVACATNDLHRLTTLTQVYLADVHVITVGMGLTG